MMLKKFHLLILLGGLLLIACNRQADEPENAVSAVQIQRLNTDYAQGTPRVSFALLDGLLPLAGVEKVDITPTFIDDPTLTTDTMTAISFADYEIPYWVSYPPLNQPGIWGIDATIYMEDGRQLESQFLIDVAEESHSIPLGVAAPLSQNDTIHTEPDLQKLSSGNDPNPALYQLTVAEAVASGKPTVVAFTTPGLCQTRWCLPVLNSVEAVQAEVGESANFIHIEVYDDFQTLTLTPEMAEWGLETEPWVYILDGDGQVTAKFGGPLSPLELEEALQPLLP